ncbi:hypothetical protein [Limnobacter sp.]|jgi:hypothetical protein|uniref:hypothetical protein n=1 Tax=Limnobacter sp. TaxID=2003368 RepID=UPI003BABEF7F
MDKKQVLLGFASILLSAQALALSEPKEEVSASSSHAYKADSAGEVVGYGQCLPPFLPGQCN